MKAIDKYIDLIRKPDKNENVGVSKCCATCEYWIKIYEECEHPDQRQDESGAYMAPPDKHCKLWEQGY